MNIHQTPESKAADEALNARLSNGAPDEPLDGVTPELRGARILDYEAESLAKPVALEACVGSVNATMMQIGQRLAEAINEAAPGLTVENFARVQPILDTYLRCMRQVDRYSHFEVALIESRKKADDAKAPVQPLAQRGISIAAMAAKKSAPSSRW